VSNSDNGIPTEFLSAVSDHCKHITTLSSGFILVMATFLDEVFANPEWKSAVVISFVAFAVSIVLSIYAQALVIDYLYPDKEIDNARKARVTSGVLGGTWVCFAVGAISLIVFAVKNLL
jgi:hypothetical protein